jgi:SAM-dependent methyltransferase
VVGLTSLVIWHDVECGAYDVDLPLWRELADEAGGPILDIGCGTGRVALDLAERGHDVTGLDSEPSFTAALAARARAHGLRMHAETADARSFSLPGRTFALAIVPMQVAQLLGGTDGRAAMLASVRRHMRPGGRLAVALADPLDGITEDEDQLPPLPDVLETHGWVYSSVPVEVRVEDAATAIDRLRQAVSPSGDLDESVATIRLDRVAPGELEAEADPGWTVCRRREVPGTVDYVGSTVVMLEAV